MKKILSRQKNYNSAQPKNRPKGRPGKAKPRGPADKAYLEFGLEAEEFEKVKRLAKAQRCTPFEACVKLVEMGLFRCDGRNGVEAFPGAT